MEQLPWTVPEKVQELIDSLRAMKNSLKLTETPVTGDRERWPTLYNKVNDVLSDVQTDMFAEQRRGRSADDIGNTSFLTTVQNRLESLCRNLAEIIDHRTMTGEDGGFPDIFKHMNDYFNLKNLYVTRDPNFGDDSLSTLLEISCTDEPTANKVISEYKLFKSRFLNSLEQDDLMMRNAETFLYHTHQCSYKCGVEFYKDCRYYQKISDPKEIIEIKWFHLFLHEESLYTGIENFPHFFLRCCTKTHAEGVAESMGNLVDIHSEKRRGLDIKVVGQEAKIHWNGPPMHHTRVLGEAALDRHFGGRKWHFITKEEKKDSKVTSRLMMESPTLPFYQ